MPTSAITAYTSTDTSASGSTTRIVPTTERKVSRHMTMTAANTPTRISSCLASTVSLVAAITPTLPVARRSCAPAIGLALRQCFTSLTTRAIVPARWSVRNIITGTTSQFSLSSPVLVSM